MNSHTADIFVERIRNNYWYGAYGPFKVVMMKDTGYINVTKLCADAGKMFRHWHENKTSQNLLRVFADNARTTEVGIPVQKSR